MKKNIFDFAKQHLLRSGEDFIEPGYGPFSTWCKSVKMTIGLKEQIAYKIWYRK